MAFGYAVFIEGLDRAAMKEGVADGVALAAQQAINKTADRARAAAAREMRSQVNFPASYLQPSAGRLTVAKRASKDNLEAEIRGQFRATSLARFVVGSPGFNKRGGVSVQVDPGHTRAMPRAFLMRLRSGASTTDTQFNAGLAIRLRPGESLRGKFKKIKMQNGLYLLYGPSVDQVFRTVAKDIEDDTADYLEREFNRLMEL